MIMFLFVEDLSLMEEAKELVDFTQHLTLVTQPPHGALIYLRLDSNGLAVISNNFSPVYITEIYAKLMIRTKRLSSELLIQAVKLNQGVDIVVWDLTAGLGKDALLISGLGYHVTMVEQNPVLATILHYALLHNILPPDNLSLVYANSLDFLSVTGTRPHIIYLDPMFKDKKSAKAKKDMQIIQAISHASTMEQEQDLFNVCVTRALNKVVVKRENKQASLVIKPKPSYIRLGNTIRYDIYTITTK